MISFANKVMSAVIGKTHLFAVGQAGFIVKSLSGQLFGIDLYLSECVERVEGHDGFKRLLPKLFSPYDLKFDCLVASHPHFDHFDMDAIPQLMSNHFTRLYASVNCEKETRRLMMSQDNVSYVRPGEKITHGDFAMRFTTCDHGSGAPDAVGLVLAVDGKRIFFAGDTCLHTERAEEYLADGNIDILVAPINGAFGNLNEKECVDLTNAIRPKFTIPCHYGMFASHGGNPGLFIENMRKNNFSYLLMTQGESFTW